MNTLTPKNSASTSNTSSSNTSTSNTSSSGSSTASSSMDIKKKCQRDHKLQSSRSRSFLHCISKHLGRHFLHHHQDAVYSSQEDIRSSSTDLFSLSFERGSDSSHLECRIAGGSSVDLTTADQRTSRTSSDSGGSRLSSAFETLDAEELRDGYRYNKKRHIYMNRPVSSLEHTDELNTDADDENENENALNTTATATTTPRSDSTASKGLHLSRTSISSSVTRMLHHFSAPASTSSLSCNNTPLRRVKDMKPKKNTCSTNSKKTPSTTSSSKKQETKQQSILRPPVSYVYMKGMSGLYSRVPRYTVCCPYAMQQAV